MWMWLVLLYGVLKGCREICKKKALLTSSSIEVLLVYTFISFLLVVPDAKNAWGIPLNFLPIVILKSFVIFLAWILSFYAIKKLPLSMYGVLDLSRVLFATFLGVTVLKEHLSPIHIIGLTLVCSGLLMLKFKPTYQKDKAGSFNSTETLANKIERKYTALTIIVALISCMLNSFSGLLDKILLKDKLTSSQLQFWYMLFLCLLYIIYAFIVRTKISLKRAITNKWIWLLAIMFVIADRALFIANANPDSRVTVMTLLKQSGAIVSILAGKFIFKEKNIVHKLICALIIIAGIVIAAI